MGHEVRRTVEAKWWSTSTVNVVLKLKRSLQCTVMCHTERTQCTKQMRGICCPKEAILVYLMLWKGTGNGCVPISKAFKKGMVD